MEFLKYVPYPKVDIAGRLWPDKTITKAPRWCSVDLREGNQALSAPMNVENKLALFKTLVKLGFKEIEVGFPASSDTEFMFLRRLIEEKHIPEDVTIQVLTQGREHIIKRTIEALSGVRAVIINLYYPTARVQREVVLRKSREELLSALREGVHLVKTLENEAGSSSISLEYCPESFMGTELDFALEACNAVIDEWRPSPEKKMIINLPSTVEVCTPNIFADRVERMCRSLNKRDSVTVSVHAHNDRGTAVAAVELAVMAGAERVEGTLFGNGERNGNLDIITMALNLYSQGIDPELDLSDIKAVMNDYTRCTGMSIHPRHPYAGKYAFTTFSGSHQDAISKGLKARAQTPEAVWNVPYLPIDPRDIGRGDERVIRINSQSGKGGISYILENIFGVKIPLKIQKDFSCNVKSTAERLGRELTPEEMLEQYEREYPDAAAQGVKKIKNIE